MWQKTIICDVGTTKCEDETIKCEKKNKGTTKCDKRTITCDVGTAQCVDEIVKCEKKLRELSNVTKNCQPHNVWMKLSNVRKN